MGISLDSAYKTFKKVPKTYYRIKFEDRIEFPNDEDLYVFYDNLVAEACSPTIFSENEIEHYYNDKYFEIDKKYSQKLVDLAKSSPDSIIKNWILAHEGDYIGFNYQGFFSARELEAVQGENWVGEDFLRVQEDGRLLMYAIDNLKYRYGIDLHPALINCENLMFYNHQDDDELLKKINCDSVQLGLEAEEKLKSIQRQDDDEFFDERMPRILHLIDLLKQGAKFIYSV